MRSIGSNGRPGDERAAGAALAQRDVGAASAGLVVGARALLKHAAAELGARDAAIVGRLARRRGPARGRSARWPGIGHGDRRAHLVAAAQVARLILGETTKRAGSSRRNPAGDDDRQHGQHDAEHTHERYHQGPARAAGHSPPCADVHPRRTREDRVLGREDRGEPERTASSAERTASSAERTASSAERTASSAVMSKGFGRDENVLGRDDRVLGRDENVPGREENVLDRGEKVLNPDRSGAGLAGEATAKERCCANSGACGPWGRTRGRGRARARARDAPTWRGPRAPTLPCGDGPAP